MEIIKVKNAALSKYEELLLRRDNLRKQAENYNLAYIREFGDLIEEEFRIKIECIRKKKEIAYCQMQINQGKKIKHNELIAYIEKEMLSYQKELETLIEDVKSARSATAISPADVKKIKDAYHRIAKLIHPDMHPELAGDAWAQELWHRAVVAYTHNNLKDIEEIEALVHAFLEERGGAGGEIVIPDIEEKIEQTEAEIEKIVTTNPYLYRLILENTAEINEKKKEYREEIAAFKTYSEQLDGVLAGFTIEEMLS